MTRDTGFEQGKAQETLQLVEALLAGATTEGERAAAARARERMLAKIARLRAERPEIEVRFSMQDPWKRRLLLAILRRYEIRPFRYPRQHRSTVMARAPEHVVEDVVWPEFQRICGLLDQHLFAVTERIIAEALQSDGAEAAEVQEEIPFQGTG